MEFVAAAQSAGRFGVLVMEMGKRDSDLEVPRNTARVTETIGRLATRKTPGKVEFEVPSCAEMIAYIRSRVEQFACSMSFTPDQIEDIKLAVGEASANALRHGANPKWRRIGVKMERRRDGIKVSILDKGCGFDPDEVCPPPDGSLTGDGRGIMFMRAVMDEVDFCFSNPGTCVELVKRFGPATA